MPQTQPVELSIGNDMLCFVLIFDATIFGMLHLCPKRHLYFAAPYFSTTLEFVCCGRSCLGQLEEDSHSQRHQHGCKGMTIHVVLG